MLSTQVPSFVLFYLGALVILCLPGRSRWQMAARGDSAAGAGGMQRITGLGERRRERSMTLQWMDLQLTPYRADRLALLFAYLFHIAALIGFIFALHLRDHLQQVAAMLYVASALGAVFAGDFLSLFIHWEMLAITSVFLIWARRSASGACVPDFVT